LLLQFAEALHRLVFEFLAVPVDAGLLVAFLLVLGELAAGGADPLPTGRPD
jgi:hypothetical protein